MPLPLLLPELLVPEKERTKGEAPFERARDRLVFLGSVTWLREMSLGLEGYHYILSYTSKTNRNKNAPFYAMC